MQPTIRSTSRPAAQGNAIGYLCMLVLLVCAIGLLSLGGPSSPFSPARQIAPVSAPLASQDAPLYQADGR
jgi:hypothetical protein